MATCFMPLGHTRVRVPMFLAGMGALTLAACVDAPSTRLSGPAGRGDFAAAHATILPVPLLPPQEALLGGVTTTFDFTADAYDQPSPSLSAQELVVHNAGHAHFRTENSPVTGLGKQYNAVYCQACHRRNGRGKLPAPGQQPFSMVLKVSLAGTGPRNGPVPVPNFGLQFQSLSVPPVPAEGLVSVTHATVSGTYGDGTPYTLMRPVFTFLSTHKPLPAGVLVSPRVSPPNVGMGLLEAIPAATITALADEFDLNRDGISGKVNRVWDAVNQRFGLGRFGLKASRPSALQQIAGAYNEDIGVTSALFPAESCEGVYAGCARHAPELTQRTLDDVTFYSQTLGVPARRNMNNSVVRLGQGVFNTIGCASCHVPQLTTGTLPGVPGASNQIIRPFTDLLLHDMGAGLADQRPDYLATGQEWRTPPLWGIGLSQLVTPGSGFLHDGRGRTLAEAILWHGGEALQARETFRLLPVSERVALIKFLQSL